MSEYSKEDLAKMEKLIQDSNALIARQEEIIERVIQGEIEIGNTRIAQLKKYFDSYSSRLDNVAKKTSSLSDNFLILDNKIAENSKTLQEFSSNKEQANYTASKSKSKDKPVGNTATDKSKMGPDQLARFESLMELFQKTIEERRNDIEADNGSMEALSEQKSTDLKKLRDEFDKAEEQLEDYAREIQVMRYEYEKDSELSLQAINNLRVEKQQEAASMELESLKERIELQSELAYYLTHSDEAGEATARLENEKEMLESLKEQKAAMAKWEAQEILKAKRKNNGILKKEDAAKIKEDAAKKFKLDEEYLNKLSEKRQELAAKELQQAARAEGDKAVEALTKEGISMKERAENFKELTKNEDGSTNPKAVAAVMVKALSNAMKKLEDSIDKIASYKGEVDTRLQGSNNETWAGSYWDQLTHDMTKVGAINPFFKQEDFSNNIRSLVDRGIAFDLEQRAFLMTIQGKIANTFDVADATLLKLIRIQQEDSTAGRLGMESAMTAFLNNMYENTEYLQSVANSVRGSLEEMQSLMEGAAATEVEFQAQKWLGSLYSVGMSDSAISAISSAFGQIAAGQIEGLEGGAGNLLVMAANDAGLPIADILTNGITSEETNTLLQAVVNYLADLYESSEDNKVVQQQLANVFGVKASDLKAATNLATSTNDINKYNLAYSDMLGRLNTMAGSMYQRTSIGEMMTNMWDNFNYSIAGSVASNPISYAIFKAGSLLDATTGGISLPDISVMGSGVALNTTVADIMRVGALGTGILGSIGSLAGGLGNSFSGQKMLQELGIESGSKLEITPRGDGEGLLKGQVSGKSTSESGYVGNASSSDVKNSALQETKDDKKKHMIEAKEEEEANQLDTINTAVVKIYELLDDVAHGSGSLRVKVEGYGLTKAGSSGSGAIGGISAINSTNGGSGYSGAGVNSSSVSGSIDTGSWIMI